MIIDTTRPEFAGIPASLNGEVLLEKLPAGSLITATVEICRQVAAAGVEKHPGWERYAAVLAAIDFAALPVTEKDRTVTRAAANQTRDAKIFGGVTYMGQVFDSDARSVMNLTGTLAAVVSGALELPRPFYWRSRDNVNVEMTLADLKGLAAAMVVAGYQAYLESWAAKDAVVQDPEIKAQG